MTTVVLETLCRHALDDGARSSVVGRPQGAGDTLKP